MTEIESLIKQAEEEVKKHLKKPIIKPHVDSGLSWQGLLDGKPYPHLRHGKL